MRTGCYCQKTNPSWNIHLEEPDQQEEIRFLREVERTQCSLESWSLWNQGIKLAWRESWGQRLSGQVFHFFHEMRKHYGMQQIPDQAWTAWYHTKAHDEVTTYFTKNMAPLSRSYHSPVWNFRFCMRTQWMLAVMKPCRDSGGQCGACPMITSKRLDQKGVLFTNSRMKDRTIVS